MTAPVDLVCELGVLQALAAAGRRGRLPRNVMGRLLQTGTPPAEVHTHVPLATTPDDCDRLLTGAWDLLTTVLPTTTAQPLITACHRYTCDLIITQTPYSRDDFALYLNQARANT